MKNIKHKILCLALLLTYSTTGCKKFLEPELPIDRIAADEAYKELATTMSVVNGIYLLMANAFEIQMVGLGGISISGSLLADELEPRTIGYFHNTYLNNVNGAEGFTIWDFAYRKLIYRCNAAIKGITDATSLPATGKQILVSELKFVRAWIYFNLVNFYGDVPIITNTDFRAGQYAVREKVDDVYKLIEQDLLEAQAGLPDEYLDIDLLTPVQERVRPTKAAATTLLARVYLFRGNWAGAEAEATKVIGNTGKYELLPYNQIFLKNSREAIWQLQPNPNDDGGTNTPDGRAFIDAFNMAGYSEFKASQLLIDAFAPGDARLSAWFTTLGGFVMPFKYKVGSGTVSQPQTEYTMVFRLAELYLIRAEARAKLNRLSGSNSAEEDLHAIRGRAGLPEYTTTVQQQMLDTIYEERHRELFLEWGDRWMTLKRTGKINSRMEEVSVYKTSSWLPYKALLPIPYTEFETNSSLRGHQNPGYLERP